MRAGVKALRGAAIAMAALLVLGAALAARLAAGPVSLGFADRWLAPELQAVLPGWQARFSDILLAWDSEAAAFDLLLEDALLTADDGEDRIQVPRMSVALKALPLLSGKVQPRRIAIVRPTIRLTWDAETLAGPIRATLRGEPAEQRELRAPAAEPGVSGELADLLAVLNRLADPQGAAGALDSLKVREADLSFIEARSQTLWRLPAADIAVERRQETVTLSARGTLADGGRLSITGRLDDASGRRSLSFAFSEVRPALLFGGLPAAAAVGGIDLPLNADLTLVADSENTLQRVGLDLEGGAGTVALAPFYERPRRFDGVSGRVVLDAPAGLLTVERLQARFAGATLALTGLAEFEDPASPPHLRFDAAIDRLPIAGLVEYWPPQFAAGGRGWIARNMPEGAVEDVAITLDIKRDDWAADVLDADAFHIDFRFADLAAHYLRPMPPITGAHGSARLTADRLAMDIAGGGAQGLSVAGSVVALEKLDERGRQFADIALKVAGPAPDVLRLIDSEPLGYARAFGIDPGAVSGAAEVRGNLYFPLLSDLKMEQVAFGFDAAVADLRIPELLEGKALEAGHLSMSVARDRLDAEGQGRLAGLDLRFDWAERFEAAEGEASTRYGVRGELDAEDLAALGIDPGGTLTGRVAVDLRVEGDGPTLFGGRLQADLAAAGLSVPALNWSKAAGEPGSLQAELNLRDPARISVSHLEVSAPEVDIAGGLALGRDDQRLLSADIARLKVGRSDLSLRVRRAASGRYNLDVDGRTLDGRGFLDDLATGASSQEAELPPLVLKARLDSLIALNGVEFAAIQADAVREDGLWRSIDVKAGLGSGDPVSAALFPGGAADRHLRLTSANAGRTLRGLGLFANARGGSLRIEADIADGEALTRMDGRIEAENFLILPSSRLSDVLEKGRTDGLEALVGEDGTRFDRMIVPFTLSDGVIDIEGARANGPSIGLTLEGQVDRKLERVNVNGVIVPAYALNALLGRIPLVGTLFSGGEGGGMFAVSYRVKGALPEPELEVFPLTALAPGILRKPFEGAKGTIEADETAERGDDVEPEGG